MMLWRKLAAAWRPHILLVGLGLLLGACTSPYGVPYVEQKQVRPFPGVRALAQNTNIRIVWVHGMCTHAANWATERHAAFDTVVGPSRLVGGGEDLNKPQRVTFLNMISGHEVETRYLVWSPLVADAKKTLLFDASDNTVDGGRTLIRAPINKELKVGLMNDCFSDAVIYTGRAGNPTRIWMRSEVCNAFGGVFSAPRTCEVRDGSDSRPVVLVSESLGSKILYDAVSDLWDGASAASRERIRRRLSSGQLMFMAANQIPLLETADFRKTTGQSPVPSAFRKIARIMGSEKTRSTLLPGRSPLLHLVAFTDPNDLLSYRLPIDEFAADGITVSNIIVSNDVAYLGVLERPDNAHCGYAWNPFVLGTILDGYDGVSPKSVPNELKRGCGLL